MAPNHIASASILDSPTTGSVRLNSESSYHMFVAIRTGMNLIGSLSFLFL